MSKIWTIITTILCIGVVMVGCAGTTDYTVSLNNDYYIAKTSANNIKVYKEEDKDITGNAPSIPIYNESKEEEFNKESIIKLGYDNYYIIAKTNLNKYYILDIKEELVFEFFSEKEFNLKLEKLGIKEIQLKDINEYK